MSDTFKALLLTQDEAGKTIAEVRQLTDQDLPDGDVLVAVDYSSLNYKDGLAITGKGKTVRTWPMVPGIDLARPVQINFRKPSIDYGNSASRAAVAAVQVAVHRDLPVQRSNLWCPASASKRCFRPLQVSARKQNCFRSKSRMLTTAKHRSVSAATIQIVTASWTKPNCLVVVGPMTR